MARSRSWDVVRSLRLAEAALTERDEILQVADAHARLRLPFPPAQIGHLPRGGVTLEYVGHGAVTSRLLDVDAEWNWEPVSVDEQGQPVFVVDRNGNPIGFWIKLTVLGITRLGFGSCNANQFDAEKVLIGDAIRNAAMRFGVALDLWIKGHAEDDEQVAAKDERTRPARGKSGTKRQGAPSCALCGETLAGTGPTTLTEEGRAHEECAKNSVAGGDGAAVEGREGSDGTPNADNGPGAGRTASSSPSTADSTELVRQ